MEQSNLPVVRGTFLHSEDPDERQNEWRKKTGDSHRNALSDPKHGHQNEHIGAPPLLNRSTIIKYFGKVLYTWSVEYIYCIIVFTNVLAYLIAEIKWHR